MGGSSLAANPDRRVCTNSVVTCSRATRYRHFAERCGDGGRSAVRRIEASSVTVIDLERMSAAERAEVIKAAVMN